MAFDFQSSHALKGMEEFGTLAPESLLGTVYTPLCQRAVIGSQ